MSKDLDPTLSLLCEGSSDIFFIANFKNNVGLKPLKLKGEPTSENKEGQGESYVFTKLPQALNQSDLRSIGVVLDADWGKMKSKWKEIQKILKEFGKTRKEDTTNYQLPEIQREGIVVDFERFRFGLWFWPDNIRDGDLEILLEELIIGNEGYNLATSTVRQVLDNNLSELQKKDQRKAQIYTWLGFQKEPGRPIGTAVDNGYIPLFKEDGITLKNETLILFKSWLQRLYQHD
jgi:hypothetical protein